MVKKILGLALIAAAMLLAACDKAPAKPDYPVTRQSDQVDDYFGTKVPDPYRWLEDDNAEEVKAWVEAQNAVTFAELAKIPFRETLRSRLTEVFDYPRYSSPQRVGDHYFFYKNDGLQNQSVIYVQKGLEGAPEVFLDPNLLSPDGTVRVGLVGASNDDRYMAVSRGEAGSDWSEIRVMEIATKTELPDRVRWVKFSGAAWRGDGFYYSGYDAPAAGQELTARNEYQKVFYHKLGDPQEKDALVFEDREHPLRYVGVEITEDERFLFLNISEGTSGNELRWRDLKAKDDAFRTLVAGFANDSGVVDAVGEEVLVYTNVDAPNYRVVRVDPKSPDKAGWVDIIPERADVLRGANAAGGRLFCSYLKDANTKIFEHGLDGGLVREIALPALGTAGGFYGKRAETTLFYTFTSFTFPPSIFKYDIASGMSDVFRRTEVKFNPEDYETRQVFYASKDGTRVPMFLVFKKGLVQDGRNPVFLTGYGGFNISELPSFSPARIVLLENGVIFALPNLRGGGEYGEAWHKAGMLLDKQNVFDDFIAAAEHLVAEKYTAPEKIAISGGSNGGLLVGAAMAQRPDLFKVALPAVGVMDMLRYHKFTVGWGWAVEYGSSDSEEHFKNLYAYSPLHALKPGVSYPATLVTTADHDDRVVPAHSFKFIAALQAANAGPNPVLIRIETRSGHGSSNTKKAIDEAADEFAFMFHHLGVDVR